MKDINKDIKTNPATNSCRKSFFCCHRVIIFKLPAPLIVITLAILSSRSSLPGMQFFIGIDKFYHFIAYAALSFAIGLWFSGESWFKHPLRNFLICTVITSVYGAIDEIHQYFVPDRVCDVWDWVADTLGGAAGAVIIMLAFKIYNKKTGAFGKDL
jgi:VanZ family protein